MAFIKVRQTTVTLDGDGAGTADLEAVNGYLALVTIDYTSTGAGTDVTLTQVSPALTYLTVTNSNTDATLAPGVGVVSSANAAITDSHRMFPVTGVIRVTVAGGTAAGTVTVVCFIEAFL